MEFIKKTFKKDTILLIYKCGSNAFGTSNELSDEDYIVVLKDFNGLTHLSNGKREYFIFGLEDWKAKEEFSDEFDEYFLMFNDEVLALNDRYTKTKNELDELITEKTYKLGQATKLQIFIKELEEAESILTNWSDEIWMLMVEKAVVHKDKSITFKFYNGKEIRVYSNEAILH